MNQGLIPRRYAKALFLLAKEKGAETPVYDAMRRLCSAFDAEPELARTMGNPAVSAADKAALIATAAAPEGAAAALMTDFVKLLEKNRRLELMQRIALAYVAVYRQEKLIYSVAITSARPLQSAELERLHSLVKKHLPASATAEFAELTDPDLIGGFTVSIDNDLLDASVATELKQLRLKLLSH